jgi:hypothetical protein
MKILIRSMIAAGIGVAPLPAFAQSQQAPAETACPQGAADCPSGMKGENMAPKGQQGAVTKQPRAQAETPKVEPEGQASETVKPKAAEGQANETTKPKAEGQATETTKPKTEGQAQSEKPASNETTASIGNVTVEQKTKITEVIRAEKVDPVDVDINISVGVAVPETIVLRRVPARIVEIVPDYADYLYFVLADGRIIIVSPDTREIVMVIV